MDLDLNRKPRHYFEYAREEMIAYVPENAKTVLEVGCGEGNFAATLKKRREAEVWAVERDPATAGCAQPKVDHLIVNDIDQCIAEIPQNYFDVVVFNDVLEHLYDPFNLLLAMKSKLKAGGAVVCSIPNVRFFRTFFPFLFSNKWEYTDEGILDKTHIRFFTKRSIADMFSSLGYTIERIEGIDKTKSLKPLLFNMLAFNKFKDIAYLRFVVVARVTQNSTV